MTTEYEVVGAATALAVANKTFLKIFKDRSDRNQKQVIGTPGGSDRLMTWFSKDLDVWVAPNILNNRYWNAFGCGDPFLATKVAPTVEINPPLAAGTSSTATLFLKNSRGTIDVAHTGRAGGGRKGVGKTTFFAYHPLHEQVFVDGKLRNLYILGSLDDPDELAKNVADFVRTIRNFKDGVPAVAAPPTKPAFRPEFAGTTTYQVASHRTASYTHGRVINSLYEQLGAAGILAFSSPQIDLFTTPSTTFRGAIFEAKTSTDTQSIFTCIGQLMYLPPSSDWKKIAVLPEPVKPTVGQRLGELGIRVLEYVLPNIGPPVFADLPQLVVDLRVPDVDRQS